MIDILLTDDNDIDIVNGDFNLGYSDNQQQKLILSTNKGDWKEYPILGVGIEDILDNDNYVGVLIEIKKQLQYDGMNVNNVKFEENGKITIEGNY